MMTAPEGWIGDRDIPILVETLGAVSFLFAENGPDGHNYRSGAVADSNVLSVFTGVSAFGPVPVPKR
jgi:hypothetical protein